MNNLKFAIEVNKIKELTSYNEHDKALLAGAKLLNNKNLEFKFKRLQEIREFDGHLDHLLGRYYDELGDRLMRCAESLLSKENYKRFHGAF